MVTRPNSNQARLKRHARVRSKVSGTAACPRLDVFRSNSNIYAQLIDDVNGVTLAAASSNVRISEFPAATKRALTRLES